MATPTVEPNYFTCTLGQAAQSKEKTRQLDHGFGTVLQLIDGQARRIPQLPAVGFADYVSKAHASEDGFLTYVELSILSNHAARMLRTTIGTLSSRNIPAGSNIGLLSTSNIDFILSWLGLLRLGYTAVFLAPQLEPQAIQHLCISLDIQALFVEDCHQKTVAVIDQVEILRLPSYREYSTAEISTEEIDCYEEPEISYFSHTSGTSSGLPKPIPQPQSGIVKVLPSFTDENKPATFSTTPLYHGGLPDLLRSWTSGSMIWFFPEGMAPITATNISKAIEYARIRCDVPVRYFTSVPYILQMLYEDRNGKDLLRSMDLVGVGGAPLPSTIGDGLVESGVNLVSRMGSMECGFLMSSHRDYQSDKEWQFLRPVQDEKYLQFEPREDGLAELVVKPDWPLRVKTNRDDGSYATADLFQPHGTIPNAWRYHSRADSQLMLASGKKFDPAPMEADILTASQLLRDVLVFGNGKNFPGVILFPSSSDISKTTVFDTIWPIIHKMNSQSQSHARISRSMVLVIFIPQNETALQKSSKGTILRHQSEKKYKRQIESAYNEPKTFAQVPVGSGEELSNAVSECFYRVLGRKIDPDEDLYKQNVDSMACLQIRSQIGAACLSDREEQLPLNVIYESGTINNLVKYIGQFRDNRGPANILNQEERRKESMLKMVDTYKSFSDGPVDPTVNNKGSEHAVVLTGATGLLGAHILHSICQEYMVDVVYLLIRAKTQEEAYQRASQALRKYELTDLDAFTNSPHARTSIVCLPCDKSYDITNISNRYLERLSTASTTFIHTAWAVNFNLQLQSFEDQISGMHELIQLAIRTDAKFVFISSIAAVSRSSSATVHEDLSFNPSEASPMGYSESKWVAEQICAAAHDCVASDSGKPSWMSIIRVGQLCGNESGIWNASEAYPLMLSTEPLVGCLPRLTSHPLDWLPVEVAAKAVLEISLETRTGIPESPEGADVLATGPFVYHVLNPYQCPEWTQLLSWISENPGQGNFEVVPVSEWLQRLEKTLTQTKRHHPSHVLLGMWKEGLVENEKRGRDGLQAGRTRSYGCSQAKRRSSTLRELKPLTKGRILKIWDWVRGNVG